MRNYLFITSSLLVILLSGCGGVKNQDLLNYLYTVQSKKLDSYTFNSNTTILSRVSVAPLFLMDSLKTMDQTTDYTAYAPSPDEMDMISNYINLLPALTRQVLKERLIGIYFVNNLVGNGLTDFVWDKDRKFYVYMVFNAHTLKKNISDLITEKENTCYDLSAGNFSLSINCGNRFNGFLYILLHESTHAVDYIRHITPFTEPILAYPSSDKFTPFTKNIWESYYKPYPENDFPDRANITFYGFNNGPLLAISNAQKVYQQLTNSPFVSLYGSKSWAEDLADFNTFYYLTQVLKEPYIITVSKDTQTLGVFEPMKSPKVISRFDSLKEFR